MTHPAHAAPVAHPRGRSLLVAAAMAILTVTAVWKLFWLLGPDGGDLRATAPTFDLILWLLGAAALGYGLATAFAVQARRGAGLAWSAGWLCAVAAQGLIVEQLTRASFEGVTLTDAIREHVFGHALALAFGLALWRTEIVRGWTFRRA
jgi:hypothetical protein